MTLTHDPMGLLNDPNVLTIESKMNQVLEKISHKWQLMMFYGEGSHDQIRIILKGTTKGRPIRKCTKKFNFSDLENLNVSNPEIQSDWEIIREILCKITRPLENYNEILTKIEIETAGKVIKINLSYNFFLFFRLKFDHF